MRILKSRKQSEPCIEALSPPPIDLERRSGLETATFAAG